MTTTQIGDIVTTRRAIHNILDDVDCLSEERAMWTTLNYFQLLKLVIPNLAGEVQEVEDILLGQRRQQPDGEEVADR